MHEIVTVQIGRQANFLATHFWNAQESYFTYGSGGSPSVVDHDFHFRPGVNFKGEETYTPRTLIYDLRSEFGNLKKWGGLYDQSLSLEEGTSQADAGSWGGKASVQREPEVRLTQYQKKLEQGESSAQDLSSGTVRYWSDFNRVFYHPRSIVQLSERQLSASIHQMETFENGEELFTNLNLDEDVVDRDFRPWAEECDSMQGIQLLCGNDDAWAGFGSRYLQALRDEYAKTTVWLWGLHQQSGPKASKIKQRSKNLIRASAIVEAAEHASMYVPLTVPQSLPSYVRLQAASTWHQTALLSAAFESSTLPTRVREDQTTRCFLDQLGQTLNPEGNQQILQLQLSRDEPSAPLQDLVRDVDDGTDAGSRLDMDFSSFAGESTSRRTLQYSSLVECLRDPDPDRRAQELFSQQASVQDGPSSHARRHMRRFGYNLPLPTPDSYPPILEESSDHKLWLRSALSTSSAIVDQLRLLRSDVALAASVEERENLVDSIDQISAAYRENWQDTDFDSDSN